jgi:hypothetical protein
MSRFIKHVGVTTNTGSRVVVVFRTIPDDDNTALVVMSDSLKDRYHQDFMSTVEGVTAQQETELFKTLKTQYFSDGQPMLDTLHSKGLLQKVAVTNVKMTPEVNKHILLSDLNNVLGPVNYADGGGKRNRAGVDANTAQAESMTVQPGDPAPAPTVQTQTDGILTDEQLAASRLNQAKQLEEEATRLREEAYELDESLKPKRGRPKKATVEA